MPAIPTFDHFRSHVERDRRDRTMGDSILSRLSAVERKRSWSLARNAAQAARRTPSLLQFLRQRFGLDDRRRDRLWRQRPGRRQRFGFSNSSGSKDVFLRRLLTAHRRGQQARGGESGQRTNPREDQTWKRDGLSHRVDSANGVVSVVRRVLVFSPEAVVTMQESDARPCDCYQPSNRYPRTIRCSRTNRRDARIRHSRSINYNPTGCHPRHCLRRPHSRYSRLVSPAGIAPIV